jgi:hypothetical protein
MIDRFMIMPFLKLLPAGRVQCRLIVPQKALLSLLMFLSYKHKIPEDVSWWKAFEMWWFRGNRRISEASPLNGELSASEP